MARLWRLHRAVRDQALTGEFSSKSLLFSVPLSTHNPFSVLGSVLATREKSVNGGLTPKTYQMLFFFRTTPEKFENATITADRKVWVHPWGLGLITWWSRRHLFRQPSFSKCFPSPLKRKATVFKFLRFEERFRKAPFSWRISVDGRPNRRNKAAFSNFGVVWTRPQSVVLNVGS